MVFFLINSVFLDGGRESRELAKATPFLKQPLNVPFPGGLPGHSAALVHGLLNLLNLFTVTSGALIIYLLPPPKVLDHNTAIEGLNCQPIGHWLLGAKAQRVDGIILQLPSKMQGSSSPGRPRL